MVCDISQETDQCRNRPSLAPALSCTQHFRKPLRNIKAQKQEGCRLITREEPSLSGEVAKHLGHSEAIKTHVLREGERLKWKHCRPHWSVACKTLTHRPADPSYPRRQLSNNNEQFKAKIALHVSTKSSMCIRRHSSRVPSRLRHFIEVNCKVQVLADLDPVSSLNNHLTGLWINVVVTPLQGYEPQPSSFYQLKYN